LACAEIIVFALGHRKRLASLARAVLDCLNPPAKRNCLDAAEDRIVGNRDKGKKEVKKPKKDTKISTALKEAPTPVTVDVVPKKRKERVESD